MRLGAWGGGAAFIAFAVMGCDSLTTPAPLPERESTPQGRIAPSAQTPSARQNTPLEKTALPGPSQVQVPAALASPSSDALSAQAAPRAKCCGAASCKSVAGGCGCSRGKPPAGGCGG